MARTDSFQKKWASAPSQFERPADALIGRGWAGGAAEDPPEAKWENWWHNRADEALAEIEANGALAWFGDVPYQVGAMVRSSSKRWVAAIANVGIEPGSGADIGHWEEYVAQGASQADAEAGTNNTRRMTALRVFQAIRSAAAAATEALRGVLRVGTQAEVNTGTLDDVAVTPRKMRFGFQVSLTSNGYIVFPAWLGGLMIQWFDQSITSTATNYSYPLAFPSAALKVFLVDGDAAAAGIYFGAHVVSSTQFRALCSGASVLGCVLAIGH